MFKSIYSVRLNDTLSNSAAPQSVDISDVRFWLPLGAANVPIASTWIFDAEDGATFEIVEATAVGGVLTITKRGLDSADTEIEVPTNRKERRPGTLIYLTAAAFDLINAQGNNQLNNTILNFTSTSVAQLGVQVVTTAQRDLLSDVIEGKFIDNLDLGALQVYIGGAWQTLGFGSPTPNATPAVVGKVKIATGLEFQNGTDITAGAYNVVIPSQVQGIGTATLGIRVAFVATGGNDATGQLGNPLKPYLTIQGAINDIGVGVVIVFTGTYTQNLILKSGIYVYCYPGVSIVGSITTSGFGNDYRLLGYADLSNTAQIINMGDNADELILECQSITVTGGGAFDAIFLRNKIDILVRGNVSLNNNGYGFDIGAAILPINGVIRVLGDMTQTNGTIFSLIYIEGTGANNLAIYANSATQTGATPIQTNSGCVDTYISKINGGAYGVYTPGGAGFTRINGSLITAATAAIRLATNNVICKDCVLLGTNAVAAAIAQDIRLYNCVSTNPVDGNTTNLITGGLITDAQVI